MRKAIAGVALVSMLATTAEAANWQDQSTNVRPGAFIGARMNVPLGRSAATKPRAELTLAPTQNRVSNSGLVRTRIGEGLAFGFTGHSKPTLTLAGMRADTALGLKPSGRASADKKIGMSTGGWVAVGVGAVAIGLLAFVLYVREAEECHEAEGGADCA